VRYAVWTLAILTLLVTASAVWAQCPSCYARPVQVQCPGACPARCPAPCPVPKPPCPQPCPQACACPCPTAVPASMGAGPADGLGCMTCPDFDAAYASRMYAQNSVIIAVTQYGGQRTTNDNLRDISGEVNQYLTSANGKLQAWYGAATCGQANPDCGRAQAIIADLANQPDNCFDAVYARTLSQLLGQSNAADTIGGQQAASPQMRQQAQFLSAKESDWTFRLDRWVGDHGQAA
jgi:hypothetical protein